MDGWEQLVQVSFPYFSLGDFAGLGHVSETNSQVTVETIWSIVAWKVQAHNYFVKLSRGAGRVESRRSITASVDPKWLNRQA